MDNEDSNFEVSPYNLCPDVFDDVLGDLFLNSFSITHVNIRSLPKNFDELSLLYENLKSKFDVISMSEVWNVSNTELFSLPGYTLEVKCRKGNARGGGVGAYIRSCLKYSLLNFEVVNAESLWLDVSVSKKRTILGIIYRKPNTDVFEFQNSLSTVLSHLKIDKVQCLLMGDFNINFLDSDQKVEQFKTTMECLALKQLITTPTRVTRDTSSLIDHAYTNYSSTKIHAGVIETDVSDHFPIFVIFEKCKAESRKLCTGSISFRSYKNYDEKKFNDDLAGARWDLVYKENDVNNAYTTFHDIFKEICDKHAPIITQRPKRKNNAQKPWITAGILKSIRKKQKLYSQYKKSGFNSQMGNRYKKYRNILTVDLKNAKRKYYSNILRENEGNSTKTWQTINELLHGKNISVQNTAIERLAIHKNGEDKVVTDDHEVASEFNDFFVGIGPSLANKIPQLGIDCTTYLGPKNDKTFTWEPVTETEVKNHTLALDIKKASGYDCLSTRLIRDASNFISTPLCHIFNMSLQEGKFPNALKIAKVTPIYKKGSKDAPGNYRPISVLPVIGKIFEKIVNKQLMDFLEVNNMLEPHQYGFRKKYSTKLSVVNLCNALLKSLDEGKITLGIFIDFQKAFDTINHDILIRKLSHYGIRGTALQWFANYLFNRFQFVKYREVHSSYKEISCGVPQGSVLGPSLFLIYINDLPNSTNFFNFRLFADDSNLFHTFETGQTCIDMNEVSKELCKVQKWCHANKVTINQGKTNYMIIRTKRRSVQKNGALEISGCKLPEVSNASFVGLEIDEHLTWIDHIKMVNKNIRSKVGILFRLRHFVPQNILILLYKALIQPHLLYGIEVWGSTYKTNLNCIYLTQKLAMRAMTFSPRDSHSDPLFQKLKILNVFQLHSLSVSTFIYDLLNGNIPHSFTEYCQVVDHEHATRGKDHGLLHLPKCKTTQGQFSISFIGVKIWNCIPHDIKGKKSRSAFRKGLVSHLRATHINV